MSDGIEDVYRSLADSINAGNCIALIGAGISASTEYNGQVYDGYPLAKDLVQDLKSKRSYLENIDDLGAAAFLFREREGRETLERYLVESFSKDLSPLPAHEFLARLDLSAYVSMNFDTLLEDAIQQRHSNGVPVIRDSDVARLTTDSVPVIKPHGCISQPESICIASDETVSFYDDKPIISNLLLSKLANRRVLYIGFSFSDSDFLQLLNYLKHKLGDYMPTGIAVVRQGDDFTREYLRKYNVRLIPEDATNFLDNVNQTQLKSQLQYREDMESWMEHKLFWDLVEIRGMPTETQLIDALLDKIEKRIIEEDNVDILASEVSEAISLVLDHRPNYRALENIGDELDEIFRQAEREGTRLWDLFQGLKEKRANISKRISQESTDAIGDAKNILLYSQSQRVVDLLTALDPALQSEITLFIGECRPKSPEHFEDAIATMERLKNTEYSIRLVPDTVMFHFIDGDHIDKVLMGAHEVYKLGDSDSEASYSHFVNTCGSKAIANITRDNDIPLYLVFEEEKVSIISSEEELEQVSFSEEEDIGSDIIDEISKRRDFSDRVRIINVGYDLVPWYENIVAVTN